MEPTPKKRSGALPPPLDLISLHGGQTKLLEAAMEMADQDSSAGQPSDVANNSTSRPQVSVKVFEGF